MKNKERIYSIIDVGHITIDKKNIVTTDVFVEMKAQGTERKTDMDLIVVFTAEQIIDLYDRTINSIIYKQEQIQ